MAGNWLLLFLVVFPMITAVISYFAGKGSRFLGNISVVVTVTVEMAAMIYLCLSGGEYSFNAVLCGMSFKSDGFRCIYGIIICFAWLITGLFSPEYMHKYENKDRYYFFYLMTLGATMGVFLSADLLTTFMCFEVMSFTSYAWVAHEETPGALDAANIYMTVAVVGGMVALMGMFMLYSNLGTLCTDELYEAAVNCQNKAPLYVAGGCLLFGFGAKAGMFPLHIWLPKAHPVAPAPASALLSGILTKTGIFGILAVSCNIFRYDKAWSAVILTLGVITMVLGAVLALFSINLKRTLACSSLSQIGFILIGVAMMGFLGQENYIAAKGTLLHMLNHSLIKLVLFNVAGVIYINLHKLDLNEIRGFGRKKPFLNICFLLGALGIGGIPFFNGYISKTLLHDSIVEYISVGGGIVFNIVEWLFLISGGLTLAYMTKLYVAIFIEKNHKSQAEFDSKKKYINPVSAIAIGFAAIILPILGMAPNYTMDRIAGIGTGFFTSALEAEAAEYFNLEGFKGAAISMTIGALIYFIIVRRLLMKKQDGATVYIDRWPKWLDLEGKVYRPLLFNVLPNALGTAAKAISDFPELFKNIPHYLAVAAKAICDLPEVFKKTPQVLEVIAKALSDGLDYFILLLRKTVFKDVVPNLSKRPHYRIAHVIGQYIDKHREKSGKPAKEETYAEDLVRMNETLDKTTSKIMGNLTFALFMACIGICAVLIYLLFIR